MKELPAELQLKIMSHTDPVSFSHMMATCNRFFIFYLPINRVIRGLASHDQAVNIQTLHQLINNLTFYREHFTKIVSLLESFTKREASAKNINIQILVEMINFMLHLDMQPEAAHSDLTRISKKIFNKLYNGLVLDFIIQKCLSLKNRPNNLFSVVKDIQSELLTVKSSNDNAGFCDQDAIIFYTALFYLDIDFLSKRQLVTKILQWLSIQERSSNYNLHTFEVMAANMRCLGYEFDRELRSEFSEKIIKNSACLSRANFSRGGGRICLDDDIAYSVIKINSIESISVEINAKRIKFFHPINFLEKLWNRSSTMYVRYLLIHSGRYFIKHIFSDRCTYIGAAYTLMSLVNKLPNSSEVKVALVSHIKTIDENDADIDKLLALYILKSSLGIEDNYGQRSDRIKEMMKNKIKTFSLDTRLIFKDVFSDAQRLEIESFGLECYVNNDNSLQYESFLSYLVSNSVSEENSQTARQLLKQHNFIKLESRPRGFYSIFDYFRYLKFQDETTIINYIDYVINELNQYLNPEFRSSKNINETFLGDLLSTLKNLKYQHLIKSKYQAALTDTIKYILSMEKTDKPFNVSQLSQLYHVLEKYISYFNEDKEHIVIQFLQEITKLIFNFNFSDEYLFSERFYPRSLIRVLFCNNPKSVVDVLDVCWMPFLVRYQPIQLGKVIAQILDNIDHINDELFKEHLISPLLKLLDFKFVSKDFLSNNTYENIINEICKCLSYKSHLLTYAEICLAGSRPSKYQHYFMCVRASFEICSPSNINCNKG